MAVKKAKSSWEFLKREWKDGKAVDTSAKGTDEAEAKPLKKGEKGL